MDCMGDAVFLVNGFRATERFYRLAKFYFLLQAMCSSYWWCFALF